MTFRLKLGTSNALGNFGPPACQTFLRVAVVISTAPNVSRDHLPTTVPAMGGENAESPVAVTEGCPAFADGCPYGKNVEVADWIKAGLTTFSTPW